MPNMILGWAAWMLVSASAAAATFSNVETFAIQPDSFPGISAPTGFFDEYPVGSTLVASSSYVDDGAFLFDGCYNPGDPTSCYPMFAGASLSMSLESWAIDSSAFLSSGVAAIPHDRWIYSPSVGGGIPPIGADYVSLTAWWGGDPSLAPLIGAGGRWRVTDIAVYVTLPAGTIPEPPSVAGLDIFALASPQVYLALQDTTTGETGAIVAAVPEPATGLLVGVGLLGLAWGRAARRKP